MIAGEVDSYRMERRCCREDGRYLWVYLSVALKQGYAADV